MSDGSSFVHGSIKVEHSDWVFEFLEMEFLSSSEILINECSSSAGVD